jgi:hypothetical protein
MATALLLVLATAHAAATAAGLPTDPTVPPPGFEGGAAISHEGKPADPVADPENNRLQMILQQGAHRAAIIGGRTVHAGDSIEFNGGIARIDSIGDAKVVLQSGDAHLTLNLLDDTAAVRKLPPCPQAPAGRQPCGKH